MFQGQKVLLSYPYKFYMVVTHTGLNTNVPAKFKMEYIYNSHNLDQGDEN